MKPLSQIAAAALAAVALMPTLSIASISGFGNFSNFTINNGDGGSAPTVNIGSNEITLINGVSENRSIFADTPQNISQFTASYTFQSTNGFSGACFVIQNNSAGAHAVGGLNDGYSSMTNSVAVSLDYYNDSTSLFTNGNVPNPPGIDGISASPVNLFSGDPINCSLTYNGSILTENFVDTVTSASFSTAYVVNIPSVVGSANAFVGLTGASAIFSANPLAFTNLEFTNSVPEPANFSLVVVGIFIAGMRDRQLRV